MVSAVQLRAAGLTRSGVDVRVKGGRLHRVHRGGYAVGHARLTRRGRMWAAILACGGPEAAAISHRSAAALHDILTDNSAVVNVTTRRKSAPRRGLRAHRSDTLRWDRDVVAKDGLPLTTVPRTLLDLATALTPYRLERACHRAEVLRLLDMAAVGELLAALPRHRGKARLARALATLEIADPIVTRSELEERFLALVAGAGLPPPLVNATIAGFEVDFVWPEWRLIAETDGQAAHLTATAFETDRRRDAALQIAGYRVVRFTWRQVVDEPERIVATLRALLSAAA